MQAEVVADTDCATGEGPIWHPDEHAVYWVDIPRGRLYRYDPATHAHELCHEGEKTSAFTIQDDGALLLVFVKGALALWRPGQEPQVIARMPDGPEYMFNDAVADPEGRVFVGAQVGEDKDGRLYRFDTDGSAHQLLDGLKEPNGMGFSPDRTRLYFTESKAFRVHVFDYDRTTGGIGNGRTFVELPESDTVPDGLTVDAEGFIWSAHWNGSRVVRYSPDGREDRRITFPVRKISSLTFGGPDYTDIYVSTAGGDNRAEEGPLAGSLFHVDVGIRGRPEFRSRIGAP